MNPYRQITDVNQASLLDLGFAGLFFNRTNFSGILKANPIGGINQTSQYNIDCRFNKTRIISIIKHLAEYRDSVEVHCDDAIAFIQRQNARFLRENCFAYFDPPYYEKGSKIYRHFYTNQDHVELSDMLEKFAIWTGLLVTMMHHLFVDFMVIQEHNIDPFLDYHVLLKFAQKGKNY